MDFVVASFYFRIFKFYRNVNFLWLREIDGSGAVQTTEIKLINIGVLAIFYIIPFVIQLIWLVLNLINSNKKSQTSINH